MPGPFDNFDPSLLTTVGTPTGQQQVPSFLAPMLASTNGYQPSDTQLPQPPTIPPPQPMGATAMDVQPPPSMPPLASKPINIPAPVAQAKPGKPAPPPDPFAEGAQMRDEAFKQRSAAIEGQQQVEQQDATSSLALQNEAIRTAQEQRARADAQLKQDQSDQMRIRGELDAATKAYANSRVDQGRLWHDASTGNKVLMGIGLALGALGAGLQRNGNGENPAMKIIQDAVKQDVQIQMADREKLGTLMNQKGSALDRIMTITRDNQATYQAAISAGYQQVAEQIKAVGMQSKSQLAKVNAQNAYSDLMDKSAAASDAAAQGAFARNIETRKVANETASVGIAGGHLALAQRAEAFNEKKEQEQLDLEAMKLQQAGKQALASQVAERGIGGIPTAVKDKDGNIVGVQNSIIKNQDGTPFVASTVDEAKTIRDKRDLTDRAVQAIDALREIRSRSGWTTDFAKSDDWQRLHSEASEALLSILESKGLKRLSEADQGQIKELLGKMDDPTRFIGVGPGLDEARKILVRDFNSTLKSQPGFDGSVEWADPVGAQTDTGGDVGDVLKQKTPLETAQGKEEGTVLKGLRDADTDIGRAFTMNTKKRDAVAEAENAAGGSATGLTTDQQKVIDATIAKAKAGDPASVKLLLSAASDTNRPSFAAGVRQSLRGDAPDIYKLALAKLPDQEQKGAQALDALQAQNPTQSTSDLGVAAVNGNAAALAEIQARAKQGDPLALRVVHLIQTQGKR